MATKQSMYQETMNDGPKMARDMMHGAESTRLFVVDLLDALKFLLQKGIGKSWQRVKDEVKFLYDKFTAFDYICGGISFALLGLAALTVLIGAGLVAYQIVIWLMEGAWPFMPLMLIWNFLFEGTALGAWMANPESWIGLHTLLEWILANIPISVVLILGGGIVGAFMTAVIITALAVRRFQFVQREKAAQQ